MSRVIGFENIDDYLGPSEARFFGSGYRRAEYDLGPVRQDGGAFRGVASIFYPSDWSKKKAGVDLRPHLSTVDTMILGAEYTELLLAASYGLTAAQRRGASIRKVVIQAGTQPEESLHSVAIEAQITKCNVLGNGRAETTSRVQIGRMRTRLVVNHEQADDSVSALSDTLQIGDVLDPAPTRYWGSGFRFGRQSIGPVTVDVDSLSATGGLKLVNLPDDVTFGLGGRPCGPTPVDAFVSVLQLAQVLMYEMDSISRADSGTLWMQQVTLALDDTLDDTGEVNVDITGSQLLDLPDGRWRNVNFSGTAGQFTLSCLFAHRLP